VGAAVGDALATLGSSLLGLPVLADQMARFRAEAPRPLNAPIPHVVSLGHVGNFTSFFSAHPPLPTATELAHTAERLREKNVQIKSLALCLWGIPGTMQGASRELELGAVSVFQSAHSVIHGVLVPAEAAGWRTAVFAHSWLPPTPKIRQLLKHALRQAYGERLKASRHDDLGRLTDERITSFALSIAGSLELARAFAVTAGAPFDLICAARYDWYVHRPLDLTAVLPTYLTTATWCTHPAHAGSYGRGRVDEVDRCGALRVVPFSFGVSDYFFLGGQVLLEWDFGSLLLHRLHRLTRDTSRASLQLTYPQPCLDNPKNRREGMDRCQKLHYVLEAHFEALGLKQRGLLRSHPQAVERVHFTLFRDRMVVLDVGDRLLNATGPLCNGRQLCALRQPSAALRAAEAAWEQLGSN